MPRISTDDRRHQLTEAALRMMARDGVAAATTRAIAAEANAPLASFHYCFPSKEEFLRELTPTVVDRMLEQAVTALDGVSVVFGSAEFTAVMCPSGSGKTTLLQVAAGIDRPTSARCASATPRWGGCRSGG